MTEKSADDAPGAPVGKAEKSDAGPLVADLYASGAIDGVTRTLQRKYYGSLDRAQVEDCVADGVEATYRAIISGATVRHPVAYLSKVASHKAYDLVGSAELLGRTDLDVNALSQNPWAPEADGRSVREEAKTRALYIARSYLPRLGQENIQRAMTVLLDAVEQDIPDLPHARIAEIVGLSEDTTRKLVNRGLNRLCELAKKDGLHIEKYLVEEYEAVADNEQSCSDNEYGEDEGYSED